jgi:hypothetical protein
MSGCSSRAARPVMPAVAVLARHPEVPVAHVLVERGQPDRERDDAGGGHGDHGGDGRRRRATYAGNLLTSGFGSETLNPRRTPGNQPIR